MARLTEKTLAEVKRLQSGGYIFAAGRYQGIPNTLRGFTNNGNEDVKFDKSVQDAFAISLMRANGRQALGTYVHGEPYGVSEDEHLTQACLAGAMIWASLPVRKPVIRIDKDRNGNEIRRVNISAGQAYYGGVGVNSSRARVSLTEYETALKNSKSQKNPKPFLDLIGRAEVDTVDDSGYDVINAGPNGMYRPATDSTQYNNRLNGISTEGSLASQANSQQAGDYFTRTYLNPVKEIQRILYDALFKKELKAQPGITPKPGVGSGVAAIPRTSPVPVQQNIEECGLIADSQLNGELTLLRGVAQANITFSNQTKSIVAKIDGFIPAEAAYLVQFDLFEMQPDLMRQLMSSNAGNSNNNVDYTHAWRAPGKLAITADITIPGACGFSIGQIFWVGRTYEHYKQFGAFQLFGLTENIDVGRGWTTTIHSRFNAMPTHKIRILQNNSQ